MFGWINTLSVYLQTITLFRPDRLPADYSFTFTHPFSEFFLETPDGERLNLLHFPADKSPRRGVVLFFHGNRYNLQHWGQKHRDFTSQGYDFVAPDYRSYGKSTGKPNEPDYYADARLVYDWLRKDCPAEQIILYGASLGTGMAAYLAAHVPAKSVVLETPFDNIEGLTASLIGLSKLPLKPEYAFPNDQHLRQATMPVLIFHGTSDRVVPYKSAIRLKASLKPGDVFVTIPGGLHSNLREFELYQEQLRAWLEG
jgi:pimeloyl-ACP methyl ester carboxylesterase